ncbi:GtrA family protein [Neorhizobium sp. JUb45]|uniref:GtrA family protein n=1 Tax=Neorhizobium sp. JUb45 TaxID=2485113 RepID=UPI00104C0656|nr:GtrA family protein [Neorhizobium sp. JUb45]TCR03915.1 putative flippase GtrA [Neorhizobium sp. JUb45]
MDTYSLMTNFLTSRLLRFLLVGVLNTVVGYSVYVLGLWAGLHFATAIAVATVLGTLFNFKSIGSLVFADKDHTKLPRFVMVYVVVYLVNVTGVGGLVRLGIADWLGGLILLIPLALLSYFLNSRYVFKP